MTRKTEVLLDDMAQVARWHGMLAVLFGAVYGWAGVGIMAVSCLFWCAVLAMVPVRNI